MKYTDEEMAEAALLLAHTDTAKALPPELESTIQDRARAVAQDMRFSTTKAGAIEVDAPVAPVIPIGGRSSRAGASVGAYLGWIAAAACFAFAIYEWRTHVSTSTTAVQPPSATTSSLLDGKGQTIAELQIEKDGGGKMKVVHLAAKAGQRYQLWTTTTDASHAIPMGSFACEPPGCDGRELALAPSPSGRPTWAWLTVVNGTEAARPTDSAAIVASGSITGGGAAVP
ncbi:MAG: hypothetical protein U0270_19625 [Labilithrix sp.]